MNTPILAKTACIILAASLFLLPAGLSAAQSATGEPAAEVKASGTEAADKVQKWESLRNVVKREYEVCIEHCGNEQNCLDKCKNAYNVRLDREYRFLFGEKEAAPEK